MASINLGPRTIRNGETLSLPEAKQPMNVSWSADPRKLYTIVVYDTTASVVHFLAVNIPGNEVSRGEILLPYQPPNPPSGIHDYFIDILIQPEPITGLGSSLERKGVNVPEFEHSYGLTLFDRVMFKTGIHKGKYPPNEQQRKYCNCVLDVQAKGIAAKGCSDAMHRTGLCPGGIAQNPYAVCAHSTKTSYRWCSDEVYDFDTMDLLRLQSYAALHNLPTDGSREDILYRIAEMKKKEALPLTKQIADDFRQIPNQFQNWTQRIGYNLSHE